jgi:N-acetylmuramoyl-L-alanine amidase
MTQQIGIYYHPTSNGSKNIAEEMKKYMKENGAGSGSWIRSDEESNNGRLGWIRELKMLSHIIEAGFMEDDTSESSNDFYAKLIAGAICMALDKVFVP